MHKKIFARIKLHIADSFDVAARMVSGGNGRSLRHQRHQSKLLS